MDQQLPAQQLPPVPVPPASPPIEKKKITPLIILIIVIVILAIFGVVLYVFKMNTNLEIPNNTAGMPTPTSISQNTGIELQTQYENPFDQNTQYVNPFSENKNPFDDLQ